MAVQQGHKSRSRRDMRRSHDALKTVELSVDKVTGNEHVRHHLDEDGNYRGVKYDLTPAQPLRRRK